MFRHRLVRKHPDTLILTFVILISRSATLCRYRHDVASADNLPMPKLSCIPFPTSSPKRNARPFPGRFRSGGRSPRAGNAPERAVWWRIPSPGHPIRRPGRRKSRGSERNPALPAPQGPSAGQARPPGRREGGARPSPRGPRLVACLFPADRRNGRLREAGPAAAPPPV